MDTNNTEQPQQDSFYNHLLYDRLMEITRWHAQLQVDFWHDLLGQERLTVADDQG